MQTTRRTSRTTCVALIAFLGIYGLAFSQQPDGLPPQADQPTDGGRVNVSDSASNLIELPLNADGGLDAGILFSTIADDLHWIAGRTARLTQALGGSENAGALTATQVQSLARNFPAVFQTIVSADGEPTLFRVDKTSLTKTLRDEKGKLRQRLNSLASLQTIKLSKVETTWNAASASPPRILVTIPGLHGVEESAEIMAKELHRRTNLPAAVFAYPNDGPIAESGEQLHKELMAFHQQYPRSRITLVTHSMGGLVARSALEPPEHRGSRSIVSQLGVDRLIQVCPPNHGSLLAEYAPLLEGFEQFYRLVNRGGTRERILLRMIADGFNEASDDLLPSSPYLAEINKYDRNPEVQYTILSGDAGPLKPGMTQLMQGAWGKVATFFNGPLNLDEKVQAVIECDELQQGRGDGVVTVESSRLAGVVDFSLLDIHHLSWGQLETPDGKLLIDEIVSRLGISL